MKFRSDRDELANTRIISKNLVLSQNEDSILDRLQRVEALMLRELSADYLIVQFSQ